MSILTHDDHDSSFGTGLVKLLAVILMLVIVMIFGALPLKWERFRKSDMVISFSNAFSGGLFLSLGILHLLPEAIEKEYQHYEDLEDKEHFPWCCLTAIISFAVVLWIEKIAFDHDHGHHHGPPAEIKKSLAKLSRAHSHNRSYTAPQIEKDLIQQVDEKLLGPADEEEEEQDEELDEEKAFKKIISRSGFLARTASDANQAIKLRSRSKIGQDQEAQEHDHKHEHTHDEKDHKHEHEHDEHEHGATISALAPYLLAVAIGIHSMFEGIAIGVAETLAEALGISIAVIFHKWAEGLTLGIAFHQAKVPTRQALVMIFIQAIMSPLGLVIGWIFSGNGPLVNGILTSISVGTFLYISTAEIITSEFSISKYKWQKYIFFLLAIGFVSSLYFIEQLTESGHDDH